MMGKGGQPGGPRSRAPHPSQDGWNSWSGRPGPPLAAEALGAGRAEECELERKQVLECCSIFPSGVLCSPASLPQPFHF